MQIKEIVYCSQAEIEIVKERNLGIGENGSITTIFSFITS